MADQPVTTPPKYLSFKFDSPAPRVRCALMKPGKIWNVAASAWEDYPVSGNPQAAHAFTPDQFFTAGQAAQLYYIAFPVTSDDLADGGVFIFSADANGGYQSKIRFVGLEYLEEIGPVIYADGATFYIR